MRIMRPAVALAGCLLGGAFWAGAGSPVNSFSHNDVLFEVEATPQGQATFAACSQILDLLVQRGWRPAGARVRIQENPFDATLPSADVVLGAGAPSEDSAFDLAAALVVRQFGRALDPAVGDALAQTVAAHLSAPGCGRRLQWERQWLARLDGGDLLSTALPELLWRTGGDSAIREAALGKWPESAYAALAARGVEHPLKALGEVAVAGVVNPEALGFHAGAAGLPAAKAGLDVRFSGTGLQLVALPGDANAVALQTLQSEGTAAWVAVKYALTGSFDAVALNPKAEVVVPLRGTAWAAVLVVGIGPGAHVAINSRQLDEYPVRLKRWDFLAGEGAASLAWETQRHEGLRGFVVEALQTDASGKWSVRRRTLVPVAEDGESSFGYAFVDDDTNGVGAYRLLALTSDGFLAEVGLFPLRNNR
ncbi:MAG TPA: hypothetical protein PK435_04095 [Thermoanaerobaculaceae bacterium]|nr:hypothetical protein [Thermoanaerobaculaceae bacterium]